MTPIRPILVCVFLACAATSAPTPAFAQPAGVPAPINPRVLTVAPAAAPIPALKYRLLPSSADMNPGDAAPVYLRIRYSTRDDLWNAINPNFLKWRDLPLDRFPTAEARKFVDQFRPQLEQIAFGAHRQICNWGYTLPEQRLDVVNVALADAQGMRQCLLVLDMKARVEIAEGKIDQAVRTIETTLAFSRHIAEGPFLINGLIGIAGVSLMVDRCDDLIAQPGVPNLYWALTALPRPMIDIRHQVETERKLCENMIPELTEALSSSPRTAAEWSSLLARMHARIVNWSRDYPDAQDLKTLANWDLARLKAEALPEARAYLKTRPDLDDKPPVDRSDDQIVALYLAARHREMWDDLFKASYLPTLNAIVQLDADARRVEGNSSVPLSLFARMIPAIRAVIINRLRIDRRIAALQTIEALRLHAAAHGGELPESLGQITEVPIPEDPATGDPFVYRAADEAAILHGLRADLPPPRISYRITIRR